MGLGLEDEMRDGVYGSCLAQHLRLADPSEGDAVGTDAQPDAVGRAAVIQRVGLGGAVGLGDDEILILEQGGRVGGIVQRQ